MLQLVPMMLDKLPAVQAVSADAGEAENTTANVSPTKAAVTRVDRINAHLGNLLSEGLNALLYTLLWTYMQDTTLRRAASGEGRKGHQFRYFLA